MKIEIRDLSTITPYAQNPRINDPAVAAVAASIDEFGWRQPIVVDAEGIIIAGHTRYKAALLLGLSKAPVHEATNLSPEQVRAYRIADNQTAALAEWNLDLLHAELSELDDLDVDLGVLGFPEGELGKLLEGWDDAPAPPAPLEPPEDPVTRPGDLWILGDHRLLCGDATNEEDVARLLDGAAPGLCVTDPPYGVDYDPAWRQKAAEENRIWWAARRVGKVAHDDRSDWSEAWNLFPGDVLYSWCPPGATQLVHAAMIEAAGFTLRMQIIWTKPHFVISRGAYQIQHEPAWYAVREGKKARRTPDRSQSTVWPIAWDANVEGGHGTQKPVECMARPIRNHEFEEVYDPFVGSGTTIVAAEGLGRRAFAMDVEPSYVDVSVRRYQEYTGREAVLDGDGRTFSEVEVERIPAEESP